MNLMRLGLQSRKTGIQPKEDLLKDKFDMEDVDEFFNESSWSNSKSDLRRKVNQSAKKHLDAPKSEAAPTQISDGKSTAIPQAYDDRIPPRRNNKPSKSDIQTRVKHKPPSEYDIKDNFRENNSCFAANDLNFDNDNLNTTTDSESSSIDRSRSERLSRGSPKDLQFSEIASPGERDAPRLTKGMLLKQSKNVDLAEIGLGISTDDLSSNNGGSPSFNGDSPVENSLESSSQKGAYRGTPPKDVISRSIMLPSPPSEGLRRSKRTKIAPLAYWRNEKIVYTRAEQKNEPNSTLLSDIKKIPLQEIVEVVHVPESSKKYVRRRSKRIKPKNQMPISDMTDDHKANSFDYESDPEIEGTEWFTKRSFTSEIFENDEKMTSKIVAWAPDGATFESPPDKKDEMSATENFKVASLFDTDSNMFAAGLLEFPLEGYKSLRNSGDSHYIFHVARGLIEVTLNSSNFVVTRGCSFEIPRYNIYSFKNLGHGNARIFFVQCQVTVP